MLKGYVVVSCLLLYSSVVMTKLGSAGLRRRKGVVPFDIDGKGTRSSPVWMYAVAVEVAVGGSSWRAECAGVVDELHAS